MAGGPADDHEMMAIASLIGLDVADHGPLAVATPSPTILISYPMFVANVRILCDKDSWRSRGTSSLATTFTFIQSAFRSEGLPGVYRGGLLYLAHQGSRDAFRWTAERVFRWFERTPQRPCAVADKSPRRQDSGQIAVSQKGFRLRLATKYLIDAMVYPILVAATRTIILHDDNGSAMSHLRTWYRQEGLTSLFCGLTASLLSSALDEVMDVVLAWCIDYCAQGSDVDLADKVLLKASGGSVVSIFTSPVNYIGVIQRCQSRYPGMLEPEPLPQLVRSLPWRGAMYQFFLFGGIMALNVRLIQWKIQLQNEEASEMAAEE